MRLRISDAMNREIAYATLVAVLALAMIVVTTLSAFVGYAHIDVAAAIRDALAGRDSLGAIVLVQLRLPRALLGAGVGFTLGLAGAAMQGLLRNPLADPGVVGVSGGAALGAVVAFYSGAAARF